MCSDTVNQKLAEMSEIFSDGYKWIRLGIEAFEEQAKNGDKDAEELMRIFNQSYRLFKFLGDLK